MLSSTHRISFGCFRDNDVVFWGGSEVTVVCTAVRGWAVNAAISCDGFNTLTPRTELLSHVLLNSKIKDELQ
ncbi:hypothetical protein OJAV_G00000190 [Oryzias javanicus]|uniref:Uncharacterized protein n=1 Tax=Oryzias javanicus TaxID=123683 RepID=A0A3S2N821_ORYJA|nr:hypothetical protein OJAV_G00000190 [Oryzias javanicus]